MKGIGTHVALLRGINVGGNNRLPMADLSRLLQGLGCQDVRTYIQSGNAVLKADAKTAAGLEAALAQAIKKELGLTVPVILRSALELQAVVKRHPFNAAAVEPKALHVGFLSQRPTPAQLKALVPPCGPGESCLLKGAEAYFRLDHGVAKTKLTNAWFDRQLGSVMTVRNWATVTTLAEWAQA